MITITVQNKENSYSIGGFQTIFTATYPCIVFARYSPNITMNLRKRTPSSGGDDVSFLGVNSPQFDFGNAVYLETGDSILGGNIGALTLYITRIDQ